MFSRKDWIKKSKIDHCETLFLIFSCIYDTTTLANGYLVDVVVGSVGTVCTSTKPFQVCFKSDDTEQNFAPTALSEGRSQFFTPTGAQEVTLSVCLCVRL